MNKILICLYSIFLALLSSCMESKTTLEFLSEREGAKSDFLKTWNFSNSGDYTFDSNYVEVTAGNANLKTIDLSHSGTDFNSGSHVGSSAFGGKVSLVSPPAVSDTSVNTILSSQSVNLMGYWRMNGDWLDSSGKSNHGVVTGPTSITNYNNNGVGHFNGDSYVNCQNSTDHNVGTGDFSIAAWINAAPGLNAGGGHTGSIFFKGRGYTYGGRKSYQLTIKNDKLSLNLDDGSSVFIIDSTEIIADKKWHHVVGVRESGLLKLYIDGEPSVSVAVDASSLGSLDDSVPFCIIGSWASHIAGGNTASQRIHADIDDVALWTSALSATEVSSLFNSQIGLYQNYTQLDEVWTPQWSSLVGYWKMDGNWQDSSGNGNHGFPAGDATVTSNSKIGSGSGSFDGAGDYINIVGTPFNFTNSFTISSWFNSTELSGSKALVCKAQGSSYCLESINGTLKLAIHDGVTYRYAIANESIKTNRWIHVASVVEFPNVYLYVNGVKQSTSGLLTGAVSANSQSLRIAHNPPGGAFYFKGLMDETAIWSSDLTSEEISLIYNRQKQKYAGHYESPIINMGTPTVPTSVEWLTDLPFMKELPKTSESSADYSALVGSTGNTSDNDLMNGIVGLWHFNETTQGTLAGGASFADSSGNDLHLFTNSQTVQGLEGILGKSIDLDGSNAWVSHDPKLALKNNFTLAFWTKGQGGGFIRKSGTPGWEVQRQTDRIRFVFNTSIATNQVVYPTDLVFKNNWTHIVVIIDSGNLSLYSDGVLVHTDTYSHGLGLENANSLGIQHLAIDELTFWNRSLQSSEILQLYRRGANRLKIQTRSCADSTCSADEEWQGPDNANGEFYFSELNNCDRLTASGVCDFAGGAEVNTVKPTLDLTNTGDFTNYVLAQTPTQYFQYRVLMESDSEDATPTFPSLTSIDFGTKYWGGKPTIVTNNGQIFTSWTGFSATTSGCTVSYQVSNDNSTWYFYDDVTDMRWEPVTGGNETNTQTQLNANASTFASAIGTGTLYFKAFLNSDTNQSCSIDEIQVTGE